MELQNFTSDWQLFLQPILNQPFFNDLLEKVNLEYENSICFPPKNLIFNAFEACELSNLKIVILGQDPYHGTNEANGLAFSVNDGVKIPPSLRNIFMEINADLNRLIMPTSGDLTVWAKQGILLLNNTLTVKKDEPNSHKHLAWHLFTTQIIAKISAEKSGIIFLLWGNFAQQKQKIIDISKHHILVSGHPSPMSANQGKWFGNKHFSLANEILKQQGKTQIIW